MWSQCGPECENFTMVCEHHNPFIFTFRLIFRILKGVRKAGAAQAFGG